MRRLPILSLLLPVVLAGCDGTAPTAAGPDVALVASRSASAKVVPFRTSGYSFQTIGATVEAGCNGTGEVRLSLVGNGVATHLGRFTVAFSFCSRPDLTLADGRGTFTAANGDLLDFAFEGTSTVVSPSSRDFTSFVTFTGGTGRFEKARGQAVVSGTVNPMSGAGSGRWDGTISSMGSSWR
jgi:hypothetical protein